VSTASDNRTVLVVFRATPAERAEIAEYADRHHGGNVSAALRELVIRALDIEYFGGER